VSGTPIVPPSADGWFAVDVNGNVVTRERVCECGRAFTQQLVSARMVRLVERRGARAVEAFVAQIPDGYVPVHCPACERVDIGFWARRADLRRERPHYTERDEREAVA
jgi:hypothetical protein